ncbi:MAG: RIP metalloprotease RseP [Planctomycetota bacterium]|jgi:membrane-associated protease RseP (regulator of RpoE activity)
MHGLLAQLAQLDTTTLAQSFLINLWNGAWPYLAMVIGFSLIIFVHELGHFLVAKWAGVRVEKFAIGFGREIAGVTRGETRYSFNILPFGGYVKMLGQEDFDDKANELIFKDDPHSFINKPVGHRAAIVSAGVIMNVLFACLLFMIVFLIGMEADTTRIGYVEPDTPADKAGLRPGDNLLYVNDEKIIEFTDARMAIMLAKPHRPIKFVVERDGQVLKPMYLKPDYRRPDTTREPRRQLIGILPGVTPEIAVLGPEIDDTGPHQPHVGDILVEVDGIEVTSANANEVQQMLAYTRGDIYVERIDATSLDGSPERVRVEIPPQFAIYPSDVKDPDTISVLGLTPLIRFGYVAPDGRAGLAGIGIGDTVLSWNDKPLPHKVEITRSIRDNPETDVAFAVRTPDGRIVEGFVRPKTNRYGRATIQAVCRPIDQEARSESGPRAYFKEVQRFGRADMARLAPGDVVLSINGIENPKASTVRRLIGDGASKSLRVSIQKPDGSVVQTTVRPQAPGSIDASYNLVADNVLRIGENVATINGRPSPAAEADIPPGATIVSVNGEPVSRWRDLIVLLRANAGTTVELGYTSEAGGTFATPFNVPHSLRTLLGVGSEARVLAIDGRRTIRIKAGKAEEEVHVGYHKGTHAILTELAGRNSVPVEFRPNPLAEPVTRYVDVSADMVDPWVGRITLAPNVVLAPATKLLKGENFVDAIWIGVHKTYYFILMVYQTIDRMVFSRSVGVESISGPLGIVHIGGRIARMGLVSFMFFMAIISANLAVINFLPLPIVDGGLMMFLLIEKIKGSPVSLRVQVATQVIGLFLIIGLFLFVTYNDALRLWG